MSWTLGQPDITGPTLYLATCCIISFLNRSKLKNQMVCALPNSVGLRLGSPLNIEPALCVNVKQDLRLNFNLLCCPLGGIKIEVGEMQK